MDFKTQRTCNIIKTFHIRNKLLKVKNSLSIAFQNTEFTFHYSYAHYSDLLERTLLLTQKLLKQGYLTPRVKSWLQTFYGRHHGLPDRYELSISQITMDLYFSRWLFSFLYHRQDRFLGRGPCFSSFKLSVLLCVFFYILFVFVLCLVCPIVSVSLDCSFLITFLVFFNVHFNYACTVFTFTFVDLTLCFYVLVFIHLIINIEESRSHLLIKTH